MKIIVLEENILLGSTVGDKLNFNGVNWPPLESGRDHPEHFNGIRDGPVELRGCRRCRGGWFQSGKLWLDVQELGDPRNSDWKLDEGHSGLDGVYQGCHAHYFKLL